VKQAILPLSLNLSHVVRLHNAKKEFRATGTGAELAARYGRWLTAMQELLSALPDERMDEPVSLSAGYHPSRDEEPMTVRDALLHAVEHCALHQGHLELTRQLLGYPPSGAQ
jgi:uncharacterized damage-inducible protein DinB